MICSTINSLVIYFVTCCLFNNFKSNNVNTHHVLEGIPTVMIIGNSVCDISTNQRELNVATTICTHRCNTVKILHNIKPSKRQETRFISLLVYLISESTLLQNSQEWNVFTSSLLGWYHLSWSGTNCLFFCRSASSLYALPSFKAQVSYFGWNVNRNLMQRTTQHNQKTRSRLFSFLKKSVISRACSDWWHMAQMFISPYSDSNFTTSNTLWAPIWHKIDI